MPFSLEQLRQILPPAIVWAKDYEKWVEQNGQGLQPEELTIARRAGVANPERIRVAVVPRIPRPDDGILAAANDEIGLITDRTGGLTLNYGILIREDCSSDLALFFHEFVHVAQYERLGGFEGFLPQYLEQCATVGYQNAPLEREAVETTRLARLP